MSSGIERVMKNASPNDAVFQHANGMAMAGISSSGNLRRPCSSAQASLNSSHETQTTVTRYRNGWSRRAALSATGQRTSPGAMLIFLRSPLRHGPRSRA